MVPTFTQQSIGQGGAQLYSGSLATPTPQTFGVASPPLELDGFGVDDGPLLARHHALHTGPHPPGWSRLRDYGASSTGSLPVTPSGLARPARAVWQYQHVRPSSGPLATLPGAPRVGLPSGFTRPLRRPGGKGLAPSLDHSAPRGAQLRREENRRRLQNLIRPTQLANLGPQLPQVGRFLARHPRPTTRVYFRLPHPLP